MEQHGGEVFRQITVQAPGGGGRTGQVGMDQSKGIRAHKGGAAYRQVKESGSQGIEVASFVDGSIGATGLFRGAIGEIGEGAQHVLTERMAAPMGEGEINQPALSQRMGIENIDRCNVAMQNAVAMKRSQAPCHRYANLKNYLQVQGTIGNHREGGATSTIGKNKSRFATLNQGVRGKQSLMGNERPQFQLPPQVPDVRSRRGFASQQLEEHRTAIDSPTCTINNAILAF